MLLSGWLDRGDVAMTFLEPVDLLGMVAGTLTTIAFVPQVAKTWKSRSANDISLGMIAVFSCGVLLWFLYGIVIGAAPIILANAITLALAVILLVLKIRFR